MVVVCCILIAWGCCKLLNCAHPSLLCFYIQWKIKGRPPFLSTSHIITAMNSWCQITPPECSGRVVREMWSLRYPMLRPFKISKIWSNTLNLNWNLLGASGLEWLVHCRAKELFSWRIPVISQHPWQEWGAFFGPSAAFPHGGDFRRATCKW